MLIQIVGIIFFVVLPTGIIVEILRCIFLEYRRDRIPILLYHRLISKEAADKGEINNDEMIFVSYDTVFAEQMEYLHKAGYTTINLDDYLAIRTGGKPLPDKPVLITFDDGYLSNYTMAYPALKKYNQKAVIFVSPEPDEHTRQQVDGIDGFLTDQQMCEMSENNISIQSHTLTHCILAELDDEAINYELEESRRRLAEVTSLPVDHIAIPRAGYNRRVKRLIKRTSYKTVCCNNKGSSNGFSNPLALPRLVIERDMSIEDFSNYLTPRFSLVLRLIGNIKRLPERLGGMPFARRLRYALYVGPLKKLFITKNLKIACVIVALLYAIMSILFILYFITNGFGGGN